MAIAVSHGTALSGAAAAASLVDARKVKEPISARPNFLVVMGYEIGRDKVSADGGWFVGCLTPNIDCIANEGAPLTDYSCQQTCPSGRSAFTTGHVTTAEIAPTLAECPNAVPHMLKAGSLDYRRSSQPISTDDWSKWWEFCFVAGRVVLGAQTEYLPLKIDHDSGPLINFEGSAAYWLDETFSIGLVNHAVEHRVRVLIIVNAGILHNDFRGS